MNYTRNPDRLLSNGSREIAVFDDGGSSNIDLATVSSFGEEWKRFHAFDQDELRRCGDQYFDLLNESEPGPDTVVLDAGCGTGRWSWYLAPRVAAIEAIDPSDAVYPAMQLLQEVENVRVTRCSIDAMPFADASFDFIMSIGVLHHVPDTEAALRSLRKKLKPQGCFLVYLYYDVSHRGFLFRSLFACVNVSRRVISAFPSAIKQIICEAIAAMVYWPLARFSRLLSLLGLSGLAKRIPLSYYAEKGFFIMRNDALDRFGTPLEKRFSRAEITRMLNDAGFSRIRFSEGEPYWHVLASA
ncbi:MAG: class I SAM-dependent methyltransferase [Bacteroidota bacterium]